MDVSSTYNYIMRGCFKDTRTYDFLGSAGAQLIEWFNVSLKFISNNISLLFPFFSFIKSKNHLKIHLFNFYNFNINRKKII